MWNSESDLIWIDDVCYPCFIDCMSVLVPADVLAWYNFAYQWDWDCAGGGRGGGGPGPRVLARVTLATLGWRHSARLFSMDLGSIEFISTPSCMRRPSGSLCLDIMSMVHLVLVSPLCSSAQCFHIALVECLEWSRSQCSWLLVSMLHPVSPQYWGVGVLCWSWGPPGLPGWVPGWVLLPPPCMLGSSGGSTHCWACRLPEIHLGMGLTGLGRGWVWSLDIFLQRGSNNIIVYGRFNISLMAYSIGPNLFDTDILIVCQYLSECGTPRESLKNVNQIGLDTTINP